MLQGERKLASDNKTWQIPLAGIPMAPIGFRRSKLIRNDENGIVKSVGKRPRDQQQRKNVVIQFHDQHVNDELKRQCKSGEIRRTIHEKRSKDHDEKQRGRTIYQTEKSLRELGDKVSADEKSTVEAAIADLKEKMNGTDIEAIKQATEKVSEAFYPIAQKMYANTGDAAQQTSEQGETPRLQVTTVSWMQTMKWLMTTKNFQQCAEHHLYGDCCDFKLNAIF